MDINSVLGKMPQSSVSQRVLTRKFESVEGELYKDLNEASSATFSILLDPAVEQRVRGNEYRMAGSLHSEHEFDQVAYQSKEVSFQEWLDGQTTVIRDKVRTIKANTVAQYFALVNKEKLDLKTKGIFYKAVDDAVENLT